MPSCKNTPPNDWPYVLFSCGTRTWELHVPQVPDAGDCVRLLPSPVSSMSEGFVVLHRMWCPDHTKYDVEVFLRKEGLE